MSALRTVALVTVSLSTLIILRLTMSTKNLMNKNMAKMFLKMLLLWSTKFNRAVLTRQVLENFDQLM